VRDALDRLPEKQRNAIIAVYLEEMTAKEYAEKVGATPNSIHNLLNRALENLKKVFSKP